MKSTILRSLSVIGLMLAAIFTATWRTVTDAVDLVVQTYRDAKQWACQVVTTGLAMAGSKLTGRMPAVLLVQARAFYFRLIRCDRPVMTDGWRMCPSI